MIHQRRRFQIFLLMVMTAVVSCLNFSVINNASLLKAEDEAVPGVKAAIRKGVKYLVKHGAKSPEGYYSLSGYALLKADEEPDSPAIEIIVAKINKKIVNANYTPTVHGIYEASVDLMALEAADPNGNKEAIIAIARYIVVTQKEHGGWYYHQKRDSGGDTSITQYAVLGLWAADRAGVKINRKVWTGVARFHLNTQRPDGGFAYHPGERLNAKINMTIGGIANLYVARKYLYPSAGEYTPPESMVKSEQEKEKENDKKEKGDNPEKKITSPRRKIPGPIKELIKREIIVPQFSIGKDEEERKEEEKKKKEEEEKLENEKNGNKKDNNSSSSKPTTGGKVSVSKINGAIKRGLEWISKNYTPDGSTYPYYFQYSMERMCALGQIDQVREIDWYKEGAKHVISKQRQDGSWTGQSRESGSTSFALLFLTRATTKILSSGKKRGRFFGKGILAGGRGLPDNLSDAKEEKGEVKKEQMTGPLSDLLSALEDPNSLKLEAVQNTIIDKFQIGDREELVGQVDRLTKLLKDSRAEVRRTVLWALGRTGDMRVVPQVIELLKDNDLDVIIEARNALCWISHRPNGFGLPATPLEGREEVQDEAEKNVIINKWKEDSIKNWTSWYRRVRPYHERDDLEENSAPVKE